MKQTILLATILLMLSAIVMVACGGSAEPTYSAEQISRGGQSFASVCSACHGPDGKGMPNLGKDLTTSQFVKDSSDDELLTLLKEGRPSGHELNTTGVDMPPRGGNPSLTDDDLQDIIAYVRSIQE